MKRVIFGILVLLAAWQLLQVPSVNAAFFAFLTLGINPLTNRPLSTLSLIFLLVSLGGTAILIFFSRALGDFLGGISDWLTRFERDYATTEDDNSLNAPASLLLPLHATIDGPALSRADTVPNGFVVVINKLRLRLNIDRAWAYFSRRARRYIRLLAHLRTYTYNKLKQRTLKEPQTPPKEKEYERSLAALQAEIRESLEQTFRETEVMELPEAVIVEEERPNVLISAIPRQLATVRALTTDYTGKIIRLTGTVSRATKRQVARTVYIVARSVSNFAMAVCRALYRGVLLMVLGVLLGFGRMAQVMQEVARGVRRAVILSAITVTLSMLALGRSILVSAGVIGHVLSMAVKNSYWLVSNMVMLVFLAAGYLLFVFTLLCFMIWEICEPYARRFDHWLESTFGSSHELVEAAKIGHEISRTFAQWYRELRNLKHSIYH